MRKWKRYTFIKCIDVKRESSREEIFVLWNFMDEISKKDDTSFVDCETRHFT